MAPQLLTTMEADELRELGQKIREYQLSKNISDSQLCKDFGELGSDSPMAMMAALLRKLGVENPPATASERFTLCVEKLNTTRRAVFIEDAHHLGPRCLALVISLIDETIGEFLLAAVPPLWARL